MTKKVRTLIARVCQIAVRTKGLWTFKILKLRAWKIVTEFPRCMEHKINLQHSYFNLHRLHFKLATLHHLLVLLVQFTPMYLLLRIRHVSFKIKIFFASLSWYIYIRLFYVSCTWIGKELTISRSLWSTLNLKYIKNVSSEPSCDLAEPLGMVSSLLLSNGDSIQYKRFSYWWRNYSIAGKLNT